MKKVTIIILLTFYTQSIFSQLSNDMNNHRKYWFYKSRLNNDFMKVGPNRGESLPFMQRGSGSSSHFISIIHNKTESIALYKFIKQKNN